MLVPCQSSFFANHTHHVSSFCGGSGIDQSNFLATARDQVIRYRGLRPGRGNGGASEKDDGGGRELHFGLMQPFDNK
jgi:hypothetical protein